MEARGLRFREIADEQHFKARLKQVCRSEALDLSEFCFRFTELFSYHHETPAPAELKAAPEEVEVAQEVGAAPEEVVWRAI